MQPCLLESDWTCREVSIVHGYMMDAIRDHQYPEEVKEELVDCGFVEVDSDEVHQLCTACLCATRTTHMLDDDSLKQYYMNILTEMQLEAGVPVLQSPRLCWVCVAHLKRSVRFREQVQDSYRLLQPMLLICDKEDLSEFLQTSVCRPGRLRTYFAHSIDIPPQDDDAQTMTADQHDDDDDGEEQLPVLIKEERENEQLQRTEADTRKQLKNNVITFNKSNTNAFSGDLKNTFNCDYCHIIFSQKRNLISHITSHMGEKPFQCEICSKSYFYSSNLIRHKRVHTGVKSFQCKVCQKSFLQRAYLISHIRSHTGVKPFQCEVCPKLFLHKKHLKSHVRSQHSGENPFQCEVCSKSFFNSFNLMMHKSVHTGEKKFQCEVCRKSFSRKAYLISHVRLHTGEKPFQCELCRKSFSRRDHLTSHMRSHTGEKPFQCGKCRRSFSHKCQLTSHISSHTGKKSLQSTPK